MNEGARQKQHFERIHDAYEDHYYDSDTMAYRDRFYYDPLFAGLDLNECDVADLASGSGHNSLVLLQRFPKARVTGFDISSTACAAYRQLVNRPCHELDLTKPIDVTQTFDVAMIVGGLHHCVTDAPTALANIASMLRPGGRLLLIEPNREFMLEGMRRLWYRVDHYFDATTESALCHDEMLALAGGKFRVHDRCYMGGIGYFLIAQSLLFRLPKSVKRTIRPALMATDGLYNKLPFRALFPYFVARWERIA